MSDNLDYKEAYLTMMRASDRTGAFTAGNIKNHAGYHQGAAGGGGVAFESAD